MKIKRLLPYITAILLTVIWALLDPPSQNTNVAAGELLVRFLFALAFILAVRLLWQGGVWVVNKMRTKA